MSSKSILKYRATVSNLVRVCHSALCQSVDERLVVDERWGAWMLVLRQTADWKWIDASSPVKIVWR